MGLRIELREIGGVANLHRSIALEGNRLRVSDRGRVRIEKELPLEAVEEAVGRARALESIQPRAAYGRADYASDVLTVALAISDDSEQAKVEVISDSRDPAPPQFWELVQSLRQLVRADDPR
jgi:hypothetical protein